MLLYLFFIFFFFLAIVWIGIALLGSFLRRLFGLGQSGRSQSSGGYHTGNSYRPGSTVDPSGTSTTQRPSSGTWRTTHTSTIHPSQSPRQKVFSSDEGEYVDFEEVK